MTKAKGRRRQEHRLKDVDGAPDDPPTVDVPSSEYTTENTYFITLDNENRVVQRFTWGERNQLIDFCLEQQTRSGGADWQPVIRYDCAHFVVHKDVYKRSGGPPEKVPVADLDDVDRGCDLACEAILEEGKWQENLRRWRDG